MDLGKNKLSPHAQEIQYGLALANRRLMELDTALGRDLILGSLDGTPQQRPACELLNEAHQSNWWKEFFDEN